jgi:DNA uptake protein ComE-like DNA-binding protein
VSDSGITHLGKQWEWWHSLWIGWTFTAGMFNWIAFLYVGARARRQRWVIWGALYSIPFILAMVFSEGSETVMDVVVIVMIVVGIASIIHAFRIRPEYLRTIASGLQAAPKPSFYSPEQRDQAVAHRQPAPPPATEPPPSRAAAGPSPVADASASRSAGSAGAAVELNTASEEELAALPGVGGTLARRAVDVRESRGGFSSVDEFGHALGLKPHVVERLRPRLLVGPRPAPRPMPRPSGRVVDY